MISDKVRALLNLSGKGNADLQKLFGMTAPSLANKLRLERFTGAELIRIADLADARLQFQTADGSIIQLTMDDIETPRTPK